MPVGLSDLYPEFTQLLIQTQFFRIYDIYVPDDYGLFTQVVPSTKEAEVYPTLGAVPQMTLFEGERKFSGVGNKQTFMVFNKSFDTGIKIPLTVFQDDQYGILTQKIAELAMEGKRLPVSLVYSVLHNGAQTSGSTYQAGFDGLPLYSQDHQGVGSAFQSNMLGGTNTLNAANLQEVIANMRTLTEQTGRPLGIIPDTLIVPPMLEIPAKQLLHSAFFMSVGTASSQNTTATTPAGVYNIPTSNEFGGILKKIIVNEYLTSPSEWHVACTGRMTKPVLLQERQAPMLTVKMDPNTSDDVMKENNAFASIYARWGAAPGNWMTVYQGSS
jgi:phage major head subunit gpT-like protein